jgi:ankyrin repeat protein
MCSQVPVDCRDEFGNTPLIIAAQNNKKVSLLLP